MVSNFRSRYLSLTDVRFRTTRYQDGTPALLVEGFDEDGPTQEILSANCSVYGETRLVIPDYSEHEGVTVELVRLGIVKIIEPVQIGFGTGYAVETIGKEEA